MRKGLGSAYDTDIP